MPRVVPEYRASSQAADDVGEEDESASTNRTASGASARVAVLSLAAFLTVGVASAPAALSSAADGTQPRSERAVEQPLLEPSGITSEPLRELPIIDAHGPVAEQLRTARGLYDESAVDRVYEDLMDRLGLRGISYVRRDASMARQVEESIVEAMKEWYPTYPYSYQPLEALFREHLSEAKVAAHPEAVVDLASLLMLMPRRPASGTTPPAAIAYVLLTTARDLVPTCDVQLSLAFLVSLGDNAPFDGVRAEAERAMQLCAGDPTPQWMLGALAAKQSIGPGVETKYSQGELAVLAEGVFAQMRERHPRSPLGWTGAADLWLDRAADAEAAGAMPFQVRKWRQQALEYYEHARTLSSATGLLAGHARALSALGFADEAVEAAGALSRADPEWAPYQALLIDVLIEARDFEGVVEYLESAPAVRAMPADVIAVGSPYGFGIRGHVGGVYDASNRQTGGGSVSDYAFFPEYENDWVPPGCIEDAEVVSLIASERASDALSLLSLARDGGTPGLGLDCDFVAHFPDQPLEASQMLGRSVSEGLLELAAAESGDIEARDAAIVERNYGFMDGPGLSEHWDSRQDFWRWVGDRERARSVVDEWIVESPEDPWAYQRMGEIQYLEGDYSASATSLKRAVDLFGLKTEDWRRPGFSGPHTHRQLALLQLGAALDSAGDRVGSQRVLREAAEPFEDDATSDLIAVMARAQLGAASLESGDYRSAFTMLSDAVALARPHIDTDRTSDGGEELALGGPLRGAELNNLALAAAKAGEHEVAVRTASEALRRDPANPIFLDTEAFVAQLAGRDTDAARAYEKVLASESSSYVSANNLAVLLAESGELRRAEKLLTKAVSDRPDYAYGWHNLGVVRGRSGSPTSFLSSQGALARAAQFDSSLRGDVNTLVVDETIYDSGVDVSRPVPPGWSYATSASEPAREFAVTMLLLISLRIAWALGLDQAGGWIAQKVSASSPTRSSALSWFWLRIRARWALLATAMVLAIPALWGVPLWPSVIGVIMMCAVVATPWVVRLLVTQSDHVSHYGWTPAIAVGVVAAPFGISFAPYPVLDETDRDDRWAVRWAPSIAMACVVAVLTLVGAVTSVPYVRTGAMMALVLLASILTPTPPFDGSKISSRLGQLAIAGALAVVSVAFVMKWV